MNLIQKLRFMALNPKDFRRVAKSLKELNRNIGISRTELEKIQADKLCKLLLHAKLHTDYWNKILENTSPNEIKAQPHDVCRSLPILNKPIIRKNGEGMWSKEISQFIVATTGGTTGYPLTIHRDLLCDSLTKAALYRGRQGWGVAPWDKAIHLFSFGKASFFGNFRMRLSNKRIGDAFPSSQADVSQNNKMIASFKPKALEGFATGLLTSVNLTKKKADFNIPIIISTGEMLYNHQRRILEEYYSGKVYTYYGSNEIGSIAYECKNQKLHVTEDHVIVETVDEEGQVVLNEPGRILVTDLDNQAMPFFRYELGDIAILSDEPCGCGNHSRVIKELIGRSQDYLSGEDGRKLQATQLSGFLKDLTDTGLLQFVQGKDGTITILHDAQMEKTSVELNLVIRHLRQRLGSIPIEAKLIEKIERTARGKQPLVVRPKQTT
jgi:phenylacetate-CoA ligase